MYPFHGYSHRKAEFIPVPLDSIEEVLKAILGVRDRELFEDRPVGASDPHLVSLTAHVYTNTDLGVRHVSLLGPWVVR